MDYAIMVAEVADANRAALGAQKAAAERRWDDCDVLIMAMTDRESGLAFRALIVIACQAFPASMLDKFIAGVNEKEVTGEYDRMLRSM
jgi:hypothetical protein